MNCIKKCKEYREHVIPYCFIDCMNNGKCEISEFIDDIQENLTAYKNLKIVIESNQEGNDVLEKLAIELAIFENINMAELEKNTDWLSKHKIGDNNG